MKNVQIIYIFKLFYTLSYIEATEPVFLDFASSYEVNDLAIQEFVRVSKIKGNSSGINSHAKYLKQLEYNASNVIASKIVANNDNIIFTPSATMSNNCVILGVANRYHKCHFITSKIEHKSVLDVFKYLEKNGYKVTYLDVDSSGKININQLKNSIRRDTKLISIQMINSEIGVKQDIELIGKIALNNRVLFHCDASQGFCRYDINVDLMNIDFLTISGHKIGAPKGIAALYVRNIDELKPILFGSGNIIYPGSSPTALISAFAAAVQNFEYNNEKIISNFYILKNELEKIKNIYINSVEPSHILSVSIDGVLYQDIIERMKNYSFSTGCSCNKNGLSNVITSLDKSRPPCTIRVSFSDKVNAEVLVKFAQELKLVIDKLRSEKIIDNGCQNAVKQYKGYSNVLQKIHELLQI